MPWRRMGEWVYRSTYSWPRHYVDGSGQLHSPAALPLGKEPSVLIGYESGCAREPVWTTWREEKSQPYRDSNSDISTDWYYNGYIINIVAYRAVSRQRLGKHVPVVTDTHAVTQVLLETVFFNRSSQRGYKEKNWSKNRQLEVSRRYPATTSEDTAGWRCPSECSSEL
jgi:hypothetical protein